MLEEVAVSAISTAKDIYGRIYIIVDYRVGIFPFSPMVLRRYVFNLCVRNLLNDRSTKHDSGIYAKIDHN